MVIDIHSGILKIFHRKIQTNSILKKETLQMPPTNVEKIAYHTWVSIK
jgi:hypothetical protein